MTSQQQPRVGYVLKMFPRLSETFVLNEVLELERQGVELDIFSLKPPADGRFHGRLAELSASIDYSAAERTEGLWRRLRATGGENPFAGWDRAVAFLERHGLPKDLELLLKASVIAARVRDRRIEHLHAHFATSAAQVATLVHLLTGVSFSFTAHAKDIFREDVDRELFTEMCERSAFVVTVSDYNRAFIIERMRGVDPERVVRLYNGIDLRVFDPARRTSAETTPHFVSVGRLVPKKGFVDLLHALAICRDRGLDFRATIGGDGPDEGHLRALASTLSLDERVAFVGALSHEDVGALIHDATLCALACVEDADGNRDALPTVLLESLAAGVPVVSTRLAGVPEIVGEVGGALVDPGDREALADALIRVSSGVRSGEIAPGPLRARCERLFDLERNVATLRGLIESHRVATVSA